MALDKTTKGYTKNINITLYENRVKYNEYIFLDTPIDTWIPFRSNEEKEYIIFICEHQTGASGYDFITNGVSTDRASQTKWKKTEYKF